MNCIIVDDERHARENLSWYLKNSTTQIDILAEADSVDAAYKLIIELNPEIVFLDISMPEKDGFQLLEMFDNPPFEVVFITAYDQYALEAFKKVASAYLLKPIDEDILGKVLSKLEKRQDNDKIKNDFEELKSMIFESQTKAKLGIPIESGLRYVEIDEILYLESDSGYTIIYFEDGSKQVSSKRMPYFSDKLPLSKFVKIHQSYLVNIPHIVGYKKNGTLSLKNGTELPVSRSMKQMVLSKIG